MASPYNVRYTLPNPILAGGAPEFWMVDVRFLAVVSISDQQTFAAKTGTEDLNAAFNKWVPAVSVVTQDKISETATQSTDPNVLFAQKDELESAVEEKVVKLSEAYGLTVHDFKFEKFGRPEDEALRLRQMGLA